MTNQDWIEYTRLTDARTFSELEVVNAKGEKAKWKIIWESFFDPVLVTTEAYYNTGEVRSRNELVFFRDVELGIKERIVINSALMSAKIQRNTPQFCQTQWTNVEEQKLVRGKQHPKLVKEWTELDFNIDRNYSPQEVDNVPEKKDVKGFSLDNVVRDHCTVTVICSKGKTTWRCDVVLNTEHDAQKFEDEVPTAELHKIEHFGGENTYKISTKSYGPYVMSIWQ